MADRPLTTISTIDGVLLVDKPAGVTSHDVVNRARRALGTRRIGHAGTLDPFATGLLVLLIGRATRLLPYLPAEPKVYDATIRFGAETATDDRTGDITREAPLPSDAAVDAGIAALTGAVEQMPPAYSAKKVGGTRAYAAARRGEPIALAPASITVHDWVIRARRADELDVTIVCSGGTYIRALARDLGRHARSAAHLAELRRTRSGSFAVQDALRVDDFDGASRRVQPMRVAVDGLACQMLDADELARVSHGLDVPARAAGAPIVLVDEAGALVAIARQDADVLRPVVVLIDA